MLSTDKILVVGCGHVGLPLLSVLVSKGFDACGVDISTLYTIRTDDNIGGQVKIAPFKEQGLQELLDKHKIYVWGYKDISGSPRDIVILTVGTPIDKNHNPDTSQITDSINSLVKHKLISNHTLLILRSTLFPGATTWVRNLLKYTYNLTPKIVFAPERIAEGHAIEEIQSIPQPIGADDDIAMLLATQFFSKFVNEVIPMSSTLAAEFVKLFSNGYRYVNFALANEFAMRCEEVDIDYNEVLNAVNHNYKRGGLAKASLNVGGYCLAKDWCLLDHKSTVPSLVKKAYEVAEKTPVFYANKYRNYIEMGKVSILGLGFKPESDNPTDSLSYKMIHLCEQMNPEWIKVYDPYIKHKYSVNTIEEAIRNSTIIFVMTNHKEFAHINKHETYDLGWDNYQIVVRL